MREVAIVRLACSSFLLSLEKTHLKLLCDSKADVTADGHKGRSRGMGNVPIQSKPKMHSGAHAYIGRHPGQKYVASAPVLRPSTHSDDMRARNVIRGHCLDGLPAFLVSE